MRFLLVLSAVLMPVAVLGTEPASPPTPAGYVSPFKGYQGWTEPAVRDWQETHALIADKPAGHAGHSMGSPAPATGNTEEEAPTPPAESHNMPDMPAGSTMPGGH